MEARQTNTQHAKELGEQALPEFFAACLPGNVDSRETDARSVRLAFRRTCNSRLFGQSLTVVRSNVREPEYTGTKR